MQRLRKLKVTKRTKKSKVPLETLLKVHYNEEDDRPLLNVESMPENKCCYGEHSILTCGFCPHCVQNSSQDERDERICSSNQSPEKNASSRNISPSSSTLDG
ncbi:predicted protein [Chaetoceros tenuissimus]|uniref:Uncharacterized protein n=1 Tax=Chaetoceros tenuissimus TaxID=426638 RepID=A0AAD3H5B1_9STRA|nr:predicted protein [Chaetoceros tenuissimus]